MGGDCWLALSGRWEIGGWVCDGVAGMPNVALVDGAPSMLNCLAGCVSN